MSRLTTLNQWKLAASTTDLPIYGTYLPYKAVCRQVPLKVFRMYCMWSDENSSHFA